MTEAHRRRRVDAPYVWPSGRDTRNRIGQVASLRIPESGAANPAVLREDHARDVREMSPRLLRQVFEEAIYADEEIVAEYLSGVLASSGDGLRNDRGWA